MYIHPVKLILTKNQKGFTLVETLVALVILSMALIPLLTVSSSTNRISAVIQDDLIASGLAQEGVEVVRAIRDTNWLNSRAFNSGLSNGDYIANSAATQLTAWSSKPLNISDGLYGYAAGTPTKFYRTIRITNVNAGEIRVVSEIAWTTSSNANKTISVEDHLFNWK